MSKYAGIEDARISGGYSYFEEGRYKVKIVEVKEKETRTKGDAFIIECEVLESSVPEVIPVGAIRSQYINMTVEPALGNIKQFMSACMACEPEEISAADVEDAVSENQPLVDMVLDLVCTKGKTQKEKKDFTFHKWITPNA